MDFNLSRILQSPSQLNDIAIVARSFRGMSDNRRKYAAGWRSFGSALSAMVVSQNPSASKETDVLTRLFTSIAEAETQLADSELRAAEDLQDVIERYDVIFRCNEVYSDTMSVYSLACLELNAAIADDREGSEKPNYSGAKYKLKAAIEKAKLEKRLAIAPFRAAVARMIEMRERYAKFRVRRMDHAWQTFARATSVWADAEKRFFRQLRDTLAEWRKEGVVGEEIVVAIEEGLAEEAEDELRPISDE
jgi:hypothetical protein